MVNIANHCIRFARPDQSSVVYDRLGYGQDDELIHSAPQEDTQTWFAES